MVGPGAGVAPFRGMIQDKEFLGTKDKQIYGPISLYFGCRGLNWDYLYKDEAVEYEKGKIVNDYNLALSREGDKVYVQHLVKKNAEKVAQILFKEQGIMYICGSLRMGKDLISALIEIATS
mmetsp:Transcript_306/g.282  ORF Transcript_306/g.282 Transcript_306/m.282 type:complete len:121 (+) Transcript_306:503-865(+)|eukprot:CAMPEP_0114582264 /NCGR_PEP_ID=MMETSP0125-20121206/6289_1 /TAXON_ID=485358 ORGANISM="Aristerostoma sp., Strain ATCC 50986" /NCGR_SAMPLE_ID=MMETSP0125 /ASSEMBLY_ACC=CAM_ASM_000245 /LENGTH=120 /DNA_ID=CAMNT_0001775131 /DNA_START=764 /DNA_END=1126 /DNA_ORIENTATION=+